LINTTGADIAMLFCNQNSMRKVKMTEYQLLNPIPMADVPFVRGEKIDKFTEELIMRQKDFLRRILEHDGASQLEWQNAQKIHTAFRLNGKLVGTIGITTGFTRTGISDRGEYTQAQAMATEKGLTGEARADFVTRQVGEALKQRYGAALEVITFDPSARPTSGELNAEMFGKSALPTEPSVPDDGTLAYMKIFAQIYAQRFGEDPFEGIDLPS
tara:strand:+ start:6280 stop:6921 length:642 start_codon:yes stop_codon:yes gene_type:complete